MPGNIWRVTTDRGDGITIEDFLSLGAAAVAFLKANQEPAIVGVMLEINEGQKWELLDYRLRSNEHAMETNRRQEQDQSGQVPEGQTSMV